MRKDLRGLSAVRQLISQVVHVWNVENFAPANPPLGTAYSHVPSRARSLVISFRPLHDGQLFLIDRIATPSFPSCRGDD